MQKNQKIIILAEFISIFIVFPWGYVENASVAENLIKTMQNKLTIAVALKKDVKCMPKKV